MMALRAIQGGNHVPRMLFSLPDSPHRRYHFPSNAHLAVSDKRSMLVSLLMAAQSAGMSDSVKGQQDDVSNSVISHRTSVSLDAYDAHSDEGHRGGVLIADDEARIRAMVGMVLSHARFHVYHAANGPEAAYHIHQVEGKIDLVITDVRMPLVTGPELAAWIRLVWPHIPVLFVSAFFQPSRLELGGPGSTFPRETVWSLRADLQSRVDDEPDTERQRSATGHLAIS